MEEESQARPAEREEREYFEVPEKDEIPELSTEQTHWPWQEGPGIPEFPTEQAQEEISESPLADELDQGKAVIVRDETYYFHLVTFEVENCLFRVPRQNFVKQSHVFQDMFTLPRGAQKDSLEGSSDDSPIRLEGVDKASFKLLLRFLYPLSHADASIPLEFDECVSLLAITHMWGFSAIRAQAISLIHDGNRWRSLGLFHKIGLAHKYEVKDWYLELYAELAMRKDPISVEEALHIGPEFTAKMAQAREMRLTAENENISSPHYYHCPKCHKSRLCSDRGPTGSGVVMAKVKKGISTLFLL